MVLINHVGISFSTKVMDRKTLFAKDIKALMYGFGDVSNPLPESVEVMDELLEWFIIDLCERAQRKSTFQKLKTTDFLLALENDPKKSARAHELLALDKELKQARATFGDTVQIEMNKSA
jgi:transcription initiation factor TFIID subunit 13